jgi:hypothetical protein
MVLTTEDLKQIKVIVKDVIEDAVEDIIDRKGLATKADLDRMESRLTVGMNLIERDSFARLDDHEHRIAKLEQSLAR